MRFDKTAVYALINVIVVFAAVIAGSLLAAGAKKQIPRHVFFVSPLLNDSKYYFSVSGLEEVNKRYPDATVTFEVLDKAVIAHEAISAYVPVLYTNTAYFTINRMLFVNGYPWIADGENGNVAVLNEALAWKLFGSTEATGQTVLIGNASYTVWGVVKQGKANAGELCVWLPAGSRGDTLRCSNLMVYAGENYNKLDSFCEVTGMLERMGKRTDDYQITDMNRYEESFRLRTQILLVLLWVYTAMYALRGLYTFGKKVVHEKKASVSFALSLVCAIVCVGMLFNMNLVELWVPHFANTQNSLLKIVMNIGVLPQTACLSYKMAEVSSLNLYANAVFCAGLVGFVNMFFLLKPGKLYAGERN